MIVNIYRLSTVNDVTHNSIHKDLTTALIAIPFHSNQLTQDVTMETNYSTPKNKTDSKNNFFHTFVVSIEFAHYTCIDDPLQGVILMPLIRVG